MTHQSTRSWRGVARKVHRAGARIAIAFAATAAFSAVAAPYTGTPIAVPTTFEAENFDKGGEGVGYHDMTPNWNDGGQYRTSEGVDIIVSRDPAGGGYVVNHFQTGEWLAYTINVPTDGNYDIAIKGANNGISGVGFHAEIDGVNVTGKVNVPSTGSWSAFQWFGKAGVPLKAGTHVLKIVSDQQYFDVNQVRVTASTTTSTTTSTTSSSYTYSGTPFTGTPIGVPKAFEAENFDKGGNGVAYKDLTAGNSGGQYRTSDSVDIIVSRDPAGGGYVVNNFQTGEWLAYTLNVPTDGNYDISIKAANNGYTGAGFHAEIDGVDVTGKVAVASTGSWSTFQWFGKAGVALKAGKRILKIVSDQQYFDVNSISVLASTGGTSTTPTSTTGGTSTGGTSTTPTSGGTSTSGTSTTPTSTTPTVPPAIAGKGYHLVKNWDFANNIRTLDAMYSEFATRYIWGGGTVDHIGGEWTRFRDNNNHVFEDGDLALTARLPAGATFAQGNLESGMLRSKWYGEYGYFEARIKVPKVLGAFPAFWLVSQDGTWPPEIDAVEIVNGNNQSTLRSFHYVHPGSASDVGALTYVNPKVDPNWYMYTPGFDFSAGFHTFAIEWTPTTLRNYVDDVLVLERPFRWKHSDGTDGGPAHVLLNYSLGAQWPGSPTLQSVPSKLQVQYIRVWQQ